MSRFGTTLHLRIVLTAESKEVGADSLDELVTSHLDVVMAGLVELEQLSADLHDPAVSFDSSTGRVDVELVVDAASAGAAIDRADATVRCAIHAAGGHTPAWEAVKGDRSAEVVEYDVVNVEAEPIPA